MKPELRSKLINASVTVCRLLLGLTFIFSGFAKAVDPYGTLYKIADYAAAAGITVWPSLLTLAAFLLPAAEFMIGVCLLFNMLRRLAPYAALAVMAVMLPISAWLAISHPVADCGCFGDAWHISDTATFWKNVVLTAFAVFVALKAPHGKCAITPSLQWIGLVGTAAYIFIISFIGYSIQPLIDFRAYKTGSHLTADTDNEPNYLFTYADADGKQQDFTIDNLPDEEDGWTYISRKNVSDAASESSEFIVYDADTDEDATDEAIETEGVQITLLVPEPDDVAVEQSWKINALADHAEAHNARFVGILATDKAGVERWRDLAMPSYPIYTAEETLIKEVARGNPAVIVTHDGAIVWKSTLSSLPAEDADLESAPLDAKQSLTWLTGTWIALMMLLVAAGFIPALARMLSLDKLRKLWK